MDKFNKLLIIESGKTKKVILNRPEKRNSLDEEMILEITCAMNKFSADEETKSVLITGAGANFCSGLNLEYLHKISEYDILQNKKDIETHLHFSCAPISFLSVPGRTDHLAYILWYIFTWQ